MRMPTAIALVLIAALIGLSAASGGGSGAAKPAAKPAATPKPPPPADIATIERRVETIRGLRYKHPPVPSEVTPAQAQRDGLEDLDGTYPPARRHADEEVLKLLGLIEPRVDLRRVSGTLFGQGVAGYYDPRTKRLRVVKGVQTTNRVLNEITLAHELNHALEDQRFGLGLDGASGSDDASLAHLSLIEGTATALMLEYATRYLGPEQTLGGLFASLGQDTGSLPPFIEAQLVFPYTEGQRFVQALYRAGGGRWAVVDAALRFRPPASTEQVLHPDAYLHVEQPRTVRLHPQRVLGSGWRRLAHGTWGEWATGELLSDTAAAAGWGGDRYELWQRGRGACAAAPCADRDALIMRWRWDTRRDAREFTTALRAWAAARRGPLSLRSGHDGVTLVLAPSAGLARRLARGA